MSERLEPYWVWKGARDEGSDGPRKRRKTLGGAAIARSARHDPFSN
jgi:hypothetical protein